MWDYAEADVREKGRVGPGEMFAVDTETGKLWRSGEIDNQLKARRPYADWLAENIIRITNNDEQEAAAAEQFLREEHADFPVFQKLFGVSNEEREQVIRVMAEDRSLLRRSRLAELYQSAVAGAAAGGHLWYRGRVSRL